MLVVCIQWIGDNVGTLEQQYLHFPCSADYILKMPDIGLHVFTSSVFNFEQVPVRKSLCANWLSCTLVSCFSFFFFCHKNKWNYTAGMCFQIAVLTTPPPITTIRTIHAFTAHRGICNFTVLSGTLPLMIQCFACTQRYLFRNQLFGHTLSHSRDTVTMFFTW